MTVKNKNLLLMVGLLIVFLGALACAFSDLGNTRNIDNNNSEVECEKNGGKWEPQGKAQIEACVMHYEDGGKKCNNSSECSGDCIVTKIDDTAGKCAMTDSSFGCHQTIEKFRAGEGILCVD
ncbi:MAG: hypothetical protein N4A38_05240 [Candidatus Gracilibacteria bacterium]|nr:hypothetical protein [Candidatus Gracilibacteria bacterium]